MKISSNYILDEVINYLRKKKKTNAGVLYVYSDFIVTSENQIGRASCRERVCAIV